MKKNTEALVLNDEEAYRLIEMWSSSDETHKSVVLEALKNIDVKKNLPYILTLYYYLAPKKEIYKHIRGFVSHQPPYQFGRGNADYLKEWSWIIQRIHQETKVDFLDLLFKIDSNDLHQFNLLYKWITKKYPKHKHFLLKVWLDTIASNYAANWSPELLSVLRNLKLKTE